MVGFSPDEASQEGAQSTLIVKSFSLGHTFFSRQRSWLPIIEDSAALVLPDILPQPNDPKMAPGVLLLGGTSLLSQIPVGVSWVFDRTWTDA